MVRNGTNGRSAVPIAPTPVVPKESTKKRERQKKPNGTTIANIFRELFFSNTFPTDDAMDGNIDIEKDYSQLNMSRVFAPPIRLENAPPKETEAQAKANDIAKNPSYYPWTKWTETLIPHFTMPHSDRPVTHSFTFTVTESLFMRISAEDRRDSVRMCVFSPHTNYCVKCPDGLHFSLNGKPLSIEKN